MSGIESRVEAYRRSQERERAFDTANIKPLTPEKARDIEEYNLTAREIIDYLQEHQIKPLPIYQQTWGDAPMPHLGWGWDIGGSRVITEDLDTMSCYALTTEGVLMTRENGNPAGQNEIIRVSSNHGAYENSPLTGTGVLTSLHATARIAELARGAKHEILFISG